MSILLLTGPLRMQTYLSAELKMSSVKMNTLRISGVTSRGSGTSATSCLAGLTEASFLIKKAGTQLPRSLSLLTWQKESRRPSEIMMGQ